MIRNMSMPDNFKYKDVIRRGRPHHERWDPFAIEHPPMDPGQWAKIFSPFDALAGFDDRISEKEVLYIAKSELSEGELAELDRRLGILHTLTANSRLARKNAPAAAIVYFSPCDDPHNEWYGRGGKYIDAFGTVLSVDTRVIRLKTENGELSISFDDIKKIDGSIFDDDREA